MAAERPPKPQPPEEAQAERWELLHHVSSLLTTPMIVLAFVWVGLLVLDFTVGLAPWLRTVTYVIWGVFIVHFLLEFAIAPDKARYLQRNALTVVSLVLPALGILRLFGAFRALRAATALRSVGMLQIVTSLNRSMRALRRTLARRGLGYVIALSAIVMFVGSAGMYNFESPRTLLEEGDLEGAIAATGFETYGEALWWTAMIMTTVGSQHWPNTTAGRILGWFLSVYGLAIFSYITASVASYFLERDREEFRR